MAGGLWESVFWAYFYGSGYWCVRVNLKVDKRAIFDLGFEVQVYFPGKYDEIWG
jgi:hypothetical protein